MPKLYPIKTSLFIKFLLEVGCHERMNCGDNGSHKFYYRKDLKRPITVIKSKKEVPQHHYKSDLKSLGITPEEFLKILKTL